jgi:hypothetical protein
MKLNITTQQINIHTKGNFILQIPSEPQIHSAARLSIKTKKKEKTERKNMLPAQYPSG